MAPIAPGGVTGPQLFGVPMYSSSFVRYERRGDLVVPVRVTKSWVEAPDKSRRFVVTRVTETAWSRRPELFVNTAPGAVKVDAPMRADLIARGHVKPAGIGACLELDDRAWAAAA